jgi:SurA N-terminal domain
VRRCVLLLAAAAVLAACGGTKTVARVGGHEITQHDVDQMVDFYKVEVERAGHELPPKSSDSYHFLEQRLLGLIVYCYELEDAAAKLNIHISDAEVEARLKRDQILQKEGVNGPHRAYIETVTRIDLIEGKVGAKLGPSAALEWVESEPKKISVEYEEGWGP